MTLVSCFTLRNSAHNLMASSSNGGDRTCTSYLTKPFGVLTPVGGVINTIVHQQSKWLSHVWMKHHECDVTISWRDSRWWRWWWCISPMNSRQISIWYHDQTWANNVYFVSIATGAGDGDGDGMVDTPLIGAIHWHTYHCQITLCLKVVRIEGLIDRLSMKEYEWTSWKTLTPNFEITTWYHTILTLVCDTPSYVVYIWMIFDTKYMVRSMMGESQQQKGAVIIIHYCFRHFITCFIYI